MHLRLGQIRFGAQTTHKEKRARFTRRRALRGIHHERQPHRCSKTHHVEALWQDTDDRVRLVIQSYRFPDDLGITTKLTLPVPVVEQHYPLVAWLILVRRKEAAKLWRHANYRKVVRRNTERISAIPVR